MTQLDVEAIRRQVRTLNFVRGTSAEVAMWCDDDADSRANLAIEGLVLEPDEVGLFDMLRDEAVPPPSPRKSSSSCSAIPTPILRWRSAR